MGSFGRPWIGAILMAAKEIVPALGLESFSCPHVDCGAIAHQTWFNLFVDGHKKGERPWFPNEEGLKELRADEAVPPSVLNFFERGARRKVFFENHENTAYLDNELINIHASKCYSCGRISLWHADELIYPVNHISITPTE